MEKDAAIYVAGHRGLVGSAIVKTLESKGYTNIIKRTHQELDLLDYPSVCRFFDENRPEYVILAAAHVGGIMANNAQRADFIFRNLGIQQNVIGESYRTGVKKLLFLGSTCIYPREAPQPIREDALLTSPLEYTNEPYAVAKIAGMKMCESFNIQYGTNYVAVMPTNLYGPNDNFDLRSAHVLPAMIRKIHLAHLLSKGDFSTIREDFHRRGVDGLLQPEICSEFEITRVLEKLGIFKGRLVLWGSGKPMREFLWSEDMAEACVFVMERVDFPDLCPCGNVEIRNTHINIGTGIEISIADLAALCARVIGFDGRIEFDAAKPDGTMRKCTDPSRLHDLGWHHTVELENGVARLYQWYLNNSPL